MRKLMLASTAIIASTGFATADVAVTGVAEMGVAGNSASLNGVSFQSAPTQFFQDIDVRFIMSGQTENGLTFGAAIDLDEVADGAGGDTDDDFGVAIFISGDFGTLTMGDTDGALDWALTEASSRNNPGSLNDDETSHFGHRGSYLDGSTDGQILSYTHTIGDFGFGASVELDDTGNTDAAYAVGVRYSHTFGDIVVDAGVGFQAAPELSNQTFSTPIATGTYTFSGLGYFDAIEYGGSLGATWAPMSSSMIDSISVGIQATHVETGNPLSPLGQTHYAIGAGVVMGEVTVHANYGMYDITFNGNTFAEASGFGLSAGYDLGNGASVLAGYRNSDFSTSGGTVGEASAFSLGLSLAF